MRRESALAHLCDVHAREVCAHLVDLRVCCVTDTCRPHSPPACHSRLFEVGLFSLLIHSCSFFAIVCVETSRAEVAISRASMWLQTCLILTKRLPVDCWPSHFCHLGLNSLSCAHRICLGPKTDYYVPIKWICSQQIEINVYLCAVIPPIVV